MIFEPINNHVITVTKTDRRNKIWNNIRIYSFCFCVVGGNEMTQKKTMTLDEFAAYIQEELPKLMAEKYDPELYKFDVFKVRKNNGMNYHV